MAFHVAQVKCVIFLHRLIKHTAAEHTDVSPRLSWFEALCQLSAAWFSFGFISKNKMKGMKKIDERKKLKLSEKLENENNSNKKLRNKTELQKNRKTKNKLKKKKIIKCN